MQEFFKSVRFKALLAVAVLLAGLMVRTAQTGGSSTFAQSVASVVASPLQSASARVSGAFASALGGLWDIGSLRAQNTALKKQVRELEDKQVQFDEYKRQNEQLTTLLNISQETNKQEYAPATVIGHDPQDWFSTFTIDKGTLAGVEKNDPVITADGLIGVVVTPMLTTSVVSTILDPSVHVGCIVSQTGDTGITQGDRTLMQKGEFELKYLDKSSGVTTGNILVTTGYSGMFPKNLKVGIVQDIQPDVSGNSLTAICKPLTAPGSVTGVYVILNFSGRQDASSPSSSSSSGGK